MCEETSKEAEKRHRKEQEAIAAATMANRSDGPIRISDIGSNTRQIESLNADGVADSGQEPKKKTRGLSKLKMHDKDKQKCEEIDFNERNQSIEQESMHLSTLEGILAREMVPINIDYWSEVPDEIKDKLWACVKTPHNIALIKPDKIGMAEWKAFVKNRLSKSFIEKSEKFKEMRAKQNYARLEKDMKNQSQDPDSISRVDVWFKGQTRQKGKPINEVLQEAVV
ncbi:unnamed protein product [Camellia sinensis]